MASFTNFTPTSSSSDQYIRCANSLLYPERRSTPVKALISSSEQVKLRSVFMSTAYLTVSRVTKSTSSVLKNFSNVSIGVKSPSACFMFVSASSAAVPTEFHDEYSGSLLSQTPLFMLQVTAGETFLRFSFTVRLLAAETTCFDWGCF